MGWGSGACVASAATKRPFVLVIDAGHGGKDAGAVGQLTKEKDINLNVALALGRLVEKNCPDVKVIYTRKTDVFVTLQGRAEIANRNKANLFISVHTNSSPVGKAAPMGAETYTLGMHRAADNLEVAKRENSVITQENNYKQTYHNFDPRKSESYIIFEFLQDRNMQQSVDLARAIQRNYTSSGRKNKGVHQAGFLVLRATSMPSVLTELGFISNAEEEKFLHSQEGVATLARAIFEGFKSYRQKHYAQDVAPTENGNDEGENQTLVAENEPNSDAPSPLDKVRDAVSVPQPVDVSTLKAEMVPVTTRPFGQPAAPVQKVSGEINKVISQPELPPVTAVVNNVASSTTPVVAKEVAAAAPIVNNVASTPAVTKDVVANHPTTTTVVAQQDSLVPVIPAGATVQPVTMTSPAVAENKVVQPDNKSSQPEIKTQTAPQDNKTSQTKAQTKAPAKTQDTTKVQDTKKTQDNTKKIEKKTNERPIFKLQLFTIDHALRSDDRHFKGLSPVEYYEEGGRYKYTYGATANYEDAKRLQKDIIDKFPEAFVVAFLNQQRIELAEAIKLAKVATKGKNE
ncbi:MAG: N-acetylmuramoyl-L-alanine amidase [Alloprevotella sp.]|nr:MAG: N-acetylmuramoyl-L-alanine amidase [Alloprevotella sp.]